MDVHEKRFVGGRVAVVTGAARGQGRSHALRLAAEGADVNALDVCHDLDAVAYDMATPDNLAGTADAVRALGRRIVTARSTCATPTG